MLQLAPCCCLGSLLSSCGTVSSTGDNHRSIQKTQTRKARSSMHAEATATPRHPDAEDAGLQPTEPDSRQLLNSSVEVPALTTRQHLRIQQRRMQLCCIVVEILSFYWADEQPSVVRLHGLAFCVPGSCCVV
eukprot:364708-Chlamydomonas_euryale.AAC.2